MKNVHLVVCDLFLPKDFVAEVCAGLRLPALEKMLARGALPVNSLWFWGGGSAAPVQKDYACISSDEALAGMFAVAADIPFAGWPKQWRNEKSCAEQLLV